MIYILFLVGTILIIYGLKMEKQESGKSFESYVRETEQDRAEYIKLLAANQEIKEMINKLDKSMEKVVDYIIEKENTDTKPTLAKGENGNPLKLNDPISPKAYGEMAGKIKEMEKENKSIEEIAAKLDIGKGEVLFLKNLFKS